MNLDLDEAASFTRAFDGFMSAEGTPSSDALHSFQDAPAAMFGLPSPSSSSMFASPVSTDNHLMTLLESGCSSTISNGHQRRSSADGHRSFPQLEINHFTPSSGPPGVLMRAVIRIRPHPQRRAHAFSLSFKGHKVAAQIMSESRQQPVETIEVAATVPAVVHGLAAAGRMPVIVLAYDEHGTQLASASLGEFEYIDTHSRMLLNQSAALPQLTLKPRKRPGEALISGRGAPVHPSPTFSTNRTVAPAVLSNFPQKDALSATNEHQHPSSSACLASKQTDAVRMPPSRDRATSDSAYAEDSTKASGSSMSNSSSSTALRHPPVPTAAEMANQPSLIRTSLLPTLTSGDPHPLRVDLQFDGSLNDMALAWSHDEYVARRRLVQFTRIQQGNVVRAAFQPIRQQEFRQTSIVVSCIFRDDQNECFITSVDAIYLLEALVGVRFSVEEKNRIRRNLEGFKPITVSKARGDCEAFFKLLMSFPNPKPRNIEKDVKVFPWKILSKALEKILSKYSAVTQYAQQPQQAAAALSPLLPQDTSFSPSFSTSPRSPISPRDFSFGDPVSSYPAPSPSSSSIISSTSSNFGDLMSSTSDGYPYAQQSWGGPQANFATQQQQPELPPVGLFQMHLDQQQQHQQFEHLPPSKHYRSFSASSGPPAMPNKAFSFPSLSDTHMYSSQPNSYAHQRSRSFMGLMPSAAESPQQTPSASTSTSTEGEYFGDFRRSATADAL